MHELFNWIDNKKEHVVVCYLCTIFWKFNSTIWFVLFVFDSFSVFSLTFIFKDGKSELNCEALLWYIICETCTWGLILKVGLIWPLFCCANCTFFHCKYLYLLFPKLAEFAIFYYQQYLTQDRRIFMNVIYFCFLSRTNFKYL